MAASHMTWRAGQQAGGGISSHFPVFQLDGTHLDHGSVQVTARSPSGHVRPLRIEVDSGGQYKTDFVPNEVGDWTMNIFYNDQHVQGSPFVVRVQDPTRIRILNMESRGVTGSEVSFSVDTTGAGEGDLAIDVMYKGQYIGSNIIRQGNVYCVGFPNVGVGAYQVRVTFEGEDVTGSPFVLNVADPTIVTASGDGLVRGKVGQPSLLRIDTVQDADISDVAVSIKSPFHGEFHHKGAQAWSMLKGITQFYLPPNTFYTLTGRAEPAPKGSIYQGVLTPVGPGAFNVEYTPEQVGDYVIEVLFYDKPINGSPFTCHVFDAAQVFVRNLHGKTVVGKPVEFDIDAHESGRGELEIVINGGEVPSRLETRGERQYSISFVPTKPIPHVIEILFNGHEVEGNPWVIEVLSLESVHTNAGMLTFVPINIPASFQVHAEADGDVNIKITNCMHRNTVIPAYVTKHSEGRYDVEFTPTEIAQLAIAVTYEGLQVHGSPFNCFTYDASAVKVSSIEPVAVGEKVTFTVDAINAGTGELSLVVNEGRVPAEIVLISQDTYRVTFIPTEPGLCTVELLFNGRPIKDNPVVVHVVDPRLILVESYRPVIPINQGAFIRVNTKATGVARLVAKVSSPNCRSVVTRVKNIGVNEYEIDFTPTELGPHDVAIEYGGRLLPCCPIVLNAYDVSRIRVLGVRDGMVDCVGSFIVDLNKCGEGELDVSVTSARGHPVPNEVKALQPGRLEVSYVPTEAGIHFAEVSFNQEKVEGCPLQFNVLDAAKVTTRGDGLKAVECNKLAAFVTIAPEAQLKDIDVLIHTPNGRELLPNVTQTKPFNFLVEYTPTMAGSHKVDVRYREWQIPGSPFDVPCWDASRVVLGNIKQCEVGCDSWFHVEIGEAGDGTVEISIAGPTGQLIPNNVQTTTPSSLEVHFMPTASGLHQAAVTFNGSAVPGSPAQFNVVDANRVLVRGEGIGLVQCGKMATFVVTSPDARLTDVDIGIIGPNGIHLVPEIKETSKGNFRVDYTPSLVGNHEICIACFGKEIMASPFFAKAWDASRVLVADVTKGHVGIPSSFKVHVGDAGEGAVEMTVADPAGNLIGTEAIPLEPGLFEVVFVPRVSGFHHGNVIFNREAVPGSPFKYLVTDTASVKCHGAGLNLVPVKKQTTFSISAPQAQLKDVDVRIHDPAGSDVATRVLEAGNSTFRVEYTPLIAGPHVVSIKYFEELVACCPFAVHAWDITKVIVHPFDLAFVNIQSQFAVNAQEAGEGKLEVVISGPQCQRVVSTITTDRHGAFLVSFIPSVSGLHRADVTYNDETIAGSPLSFIVADPANVSVSGEGIDSVRCHKPAHFTLTTPAAKHSNIHVKITGPNKKHVNHKLSESGAGTFTVEYTPVVPGNHEIAVKYFDTKIMGSPFTAHAWDPSGVELRNFGPGCIGAPYTFFLDANKAGRGSLEVNVQCRGETIPNVARAVGGTTEIEVSFLPKYVDFHQVYVKFNGETVPGSPFVVSIVDGSLVTASGPGLSSSVIAHKPTTFSLSTAKAGGDASLAVYITGPSNTLLEDLMYEGCGASGFTVSYIPKEAGTHTINVKYADIAIQGSPFSVQVFDPSAVCLLGELASMGRIGKAISVEADTTFAGPGIISSRVKGPHSQPGVTISGSGEGVTALSFAPVEAGRHLLFVLFNNYNIPGSPFVTNVIDPKTISVNWDDLYKRPIGQPIEVLVRTEHSSSDFSCSVSDPYGRSLNVVHAATDLTHGFMFIGHDVGPHAINLKCGSEHVPGSPYTCYVWDIERVRILDAVPSGNVGEEITFIVDTSEAGLGDIDVDVIHGTDSVPIRRQTLRPGQDRFSFVVASPKDHLINVKFNMELLPGSPMVLPITNPAGKMILSNGNSARYVQVGESVWSVVSPPGFPVNPRDFLPTVTAPNGELVGVNILPQNDGGIKLEYRSSFTGPHTLEVTYGAQPIPGSPIVTELFDVNKIILEGTRSAKAGEPVIIDVIRACAGEAELSIVINDPQGNNQPFQVDLNEYGETVTYIPERAGVYAINVVFGGLPVPGCPVRQEITPAPFASLHGAIVESTLVGRPVELTVDVRGESGELYAEVQGPKTLANCVIEPAAGGLINVECTPAEVGVFSVKLLWNGNAVQGTPFKMNVIDPTKIEIVNYSDSWISPDHMNVQVDKLQSIVFDCRYAGPGQFKATVEGNDGDIGADVLPIGLSEYAVKFVPRKTGDYYIRVYWSGSPIDKFPIIAYAGNVVDPMARAVEEHAIKPELVKVNGYGITTGRTGEPCDFTVDGTCAGPGILEVNLVGLKCDIDVDIVQLSDSLFGCSYVPELPGAYLLTVLWSGQHVPGSPFKVSVVSGCDAGKVVCSGDGLTTAMLGRNASVLIDCRRAGNGAVMAQCSGPTQMAYCTLIDRYDGTFELTINPAEVGQHTLEIKYGDEPVPKSPFTVKVTTAPDASKVLVSGDGINNGILATYQSSFNVDTHGAGPGQLTVKVRGPKGAFKVEMMKEAGNNRVIACRYHPTEVGEYLVCVLWSGQHVPGSPFVVSIVDSLNELEQIGGYVPRAYNNESLRNLSMFSGNRLLYNEDYQ